jgi:hypothetical protein
MHAGVLMSSRIQAINKRSDAFILLLRSELALQPGRGSNSNYSLSNIDVLTNGEVIDNALEYVQESNQDPF